MVRDYQVKIYSTDGESQEEQGAAARRFCTALEEALGDASLVEPVYRAYLRIVAIHGADASVAALTEAEREVFSQWQAAETAAVAAAFGAHRYMGDAHYEIVLP